MKLNNYYIKVLVVLITTQNMVGVRVFKVGSFKFVIPYEEETFCWLQNSHVLSVFLSLYPIPIFHSKLSMVYFHHKVPCSQSFM